ncbi:MAG: hypothetical protein IJ514_08060 [Clostridia bacterium]|nr:hypothetical protein [Clostridia bacterium]
MIEGTTQEEVDRYCEMFQELFSAPLYRHGTYSKKGYGNGYKRTTMSIPDYMLLDKYEELAKVKDKVLNHTKQSSENRKKIENLHKKDKK